MKAAVLACLAAVAVAAPTASPSMRRRQANPEAAAGLTDIDILNFALSLEWLEGEFYAQGVTQLGVEAFTAIGLTPEQVNSIAEIGLTEFDHASFLQGAIAQAGFAPAEPCQYNFQFTDALSMAQTAAVLESVGVGAYLGAAQLVADAGILTAAGSILTIEARHQTAIRNLIGQAGVPQPFDLALTPRMAFSLAAPFVASCPDGSNLAIPAFTAMTQVQPAAGSPLVAGTQLVFQSDALAQSTHCAFVSGGLPGGAIFVELDATGGCILPQNVLGVSFVALTNSGPLDGVLTDDIIMAGPLPLSIT